MKRLTSVLSVLLLSLVACSTTTVNFLDAPAQPAASGVAEVWLDDNGNAAVELSFQHLAKPDRLSPPKAFYLVWAESSFGRTTLLGKLQVTKKLKASWAGSVPFELFRMIVSAEDSETPQQPSAPFVLVTRYLEPKSGLF